MSRPDWTRFTPYAALIRLEAGKQGVSPSFVAATIAQETGGLFHPYAFAPGENSYGLGQLRSIYHAAKWAPGPWWDPERNIRACAAAVATIAEAMDVAKAPLSWQQWMLLRQGYARGPEGVRKLWGSRPTLRQMLDTRVGRDAWAWSGAITREPVSHPRWGGGVGRLFPEAWRSDERGRDVRWRCGPLELQTTAWARDKWQPLLATAVFRHGAQRWTATELAAVAVSDAPLPGALAWRDADAAARRAKARLAVLLLKTSCVLREYCGAGPELGITSTYRPQAWDDRHNPGVRHSPHAAGYAADLALSELNRSGGTSSALAAARTLAGWAYGPDLAELGGLGVYARTPGMVHVDARPRTSYSLARWAWNYPRLII